MMLNNDKPKVSMKTVIMPGFSELIIMVNPTGEVAREGPVSYIMPWLYAPWPDAKKRGVVQMEVEGQTLRDLLAEISRQYKQANIDFEPINPANNDLDFDYHALVNGKDYLVLSHGLDTKLNDGDEVRVKMSWRWDG
jgi:molybdopterin converting factor small subunit